MAVIDQQFYHGTDSYSDGDAAEETLLRLVREGKSFSDLEGMTNTDPLAWPLVYHLSPLRENICSWVPFQPGAKVLEIGAGCGAVTGALLGKGLQVTSVDLSLRRSTINYERHKDAEDLRLLVGNLNDMVFPEPFDCVLLIGVLEYAGRFTEGENPWQAFLQRIRTLLKPEGRLLLAIENRLGLKYFAGAAEDHVGEQYAGIRDYEDARFRGVRTFSRSELTTLLEESGFAGHRFFYPYPDYKFPTEIFTEESLIPQGYGKPAPFYDEDRVVLFREEKVAQVLARDGAAGALANSFLVEAAVSEAALFPHRPFYVRLNAGRQEAFRIGTKISGTDAPDQVSKYALSPASEAHIARLAENEERIGAHRRVLRGQREGLEIRYPFSPLPTLEQALQKAAERGDKGEILQIFESIRDFAAIEPAKTAYDSEAFSAWFGPERLTESEPLCTSVANVDLMPDNIFVEGDALIMNDCEWVTDFPVPVDFLLFRSVESVYLRLPLLNKVFRKEDLYGALRIAPADCVVYAAWSLHFENSYVSDGRLAAFAKETRMAARTPIQAEKVELELRQEILNKQGHIDILLESDRELQQLHRSWVWKLYSGWRGLRDFIAPKDSRRRLMLKLVAKFVRHPVGSFRRLDWDHTKKFVKGLSSGNIASTSARLDNYLGGGSFEGEKPEQFPVVEYQKREEVPSFHVPTSESPLVSIIIPVYNQFAYTYACLKSIAKNTGDIPFEVIIADDGSTDLTTEIDQMISGIRVIRNPENLRFLRNCNNAAKSARGSYLLFLNNDTQVLANWLAPLLSLIQKEEDIGMVGSKLIYPDGRLQEAGGIVWKDASAWNYGHLMDPAASEYNYVKEADYISGAAIMIRADLWNRLGGFDELFAPAYYEDTDLAFQVRAAGYRVMYQPLSVVIHFEGISNGTDTSGGVKAAQTENQTKFYEKWKNVLEAEQDPNGENVFSARDRSQRKKHLLVVDHYVPQYDKDAGGRCTWMYLKIFVRMGFRVTFIGDNFFRHEPYTTELNQLGIEVLYGNYYYANWQTWLKENGKVFDYIYLQRPHISIKYIDLVKKFSQAKVVYFAHDLHYVREQREYEITGDAKLLQSAAEWKKKEYKLFSEADVGHVVGSYEQEILRNAFPGKPIRNIPLYVYETLPEHIEKDFSRRKDLLYVGGFNHHPNVDAVVWFAREVFPGILKRYPDIVWHLVGGHLTKEVEDLASDHIILHGFVSDEELERFYRTCRIAVVPLRYGAGVKGKVLEANYYQIPLVTTPIGAEGISLEEESMLVEDDAERMTSLICDLYEDWDRLRELSDRGALLIRNHYMLSEAERILRLDFQPD